MPQKPSPHSRHVIAALMAATMTFTGCMVGPKYVRPPVEQPAGFKSPAPDGDQGTLTEEWWRLYKDAELDRLIAAANAANQTIHQAVARVDQARALARVAASFLYPTVTAGPTYTRERTSANRISTVTGQRVPAGATFNDWLLPADASYEEDSWGRVPRSLP